jgi:hypothetical protein
MSFVLVFDVVAGHRDLQQIAAGGLLPGSAGRPHEALVDPGDRCRLARRDLAAGERGSDRIHRPRQVLRRRFVNFAVADGSDDGSDNVIGRSWHRGSTRSRHSFIANKSPASAASTALRVNLGLRHRANSPRRPSPCCASLAAGPRQDSKNRSV